MHNVSNSPEKETPRSSIDELAELRKAATAALGCLESGGIETCRRLLRVALCAPPVESALPFVLLSTKAAGSAKLCAGAVVEPGPAQADLKEKLAFTEAVLSEARKDSDRLGVVLDEVKRSEADAAKASEEYGANVAYGDATDEYRKGRAHALGELVARLASLGVLFVLAVLFAACGGSPSAECVASSGELAVMDRCVSVCGGSFRAELSEGSCEPVTLGATSEERDCFARCEILDGGAS